MKKKRIIGPQKKTSSMIALANEYSEHLKKYLDTGQEKPDPQSFLAKYARKAKKDELRMHLNLATLLAAYGAMQRQKAQKALRNDRKFQISKQKFFDQLLKKSSGTR